MRAYIKGNQRKDGKYKITMVYQGAPNAFGGFYPSRSYTKIYTPEKVVEAMVSAEHFEGADHTLMSMYNEVKS
jgi:hypothetical protein